MYEKAGAKVRQFLRTIQKYFHFFSINKQKPLKNKDSPRINSQGVTLLFNLKSLMYEKAGAKVQQFSRTIQKYF
jgi:hypothetical protein